MSAAEGREVPVWLCLDWVPQGLAETAAALELRGDLWLSMLVGWTEEAVTALREYDAALEASGAGAVENLDAVVDELVGVARLRLFGDLLAALGRRFESADHDRADRELDELLEVLDGGGVLQLLAAVRPSGATSGGPEGGAER